VEPFDVSAIRDAYNAVADDYVAAFADDLVGLPVDRATLDAAVGRFRGAGPVLDLGCGPGQVGSYLCTRGLQVIGLDLATQMLRLAAERTNIACFTCGDMRALPFRSKTFSAVVAFYSIQHLPRTALSNLLNEIRRVLTTDGILVLATHLGEGEFYTNEFLGHEIDPVGGTFYGAEELRTELLGQGFLVERSRRRDPLPHEHQSQRIYVIARHDEK
jgi:SAM-dependent methyltransferase